MIFWPPWADASVLQLSQWLHAQLESQALLNSTSTTLSRYPWSQHLLGPPTVTKTVTRGLSCTLFGDSASGMCILAFRAH